MPIFVDVGGPPASAGPPAAELPLRLADNSMSWRETDELVRNGMSWARV
jgi:hypothetical protein